VVKREKELENDERELQDFNKLVIAISTAFIGAGAIVLFLLYYSFHYVDFNAFAYTTASTVMVTGILVLTFQFRYFKHNIALAEHVRNRAQRAEIKYLFAGGNNVWAVLDREIIENHIYAKKRTDLYLLDVDDEGSLTIEKHGKDVIYNDGPYEKTYKLPYFDSSRCQ